MRAVMEKRMAGAGAQAASDLPSRDLFATSARLHNVSAGSLAEDRRWLFHPCFATRLGGVSGDRETQG